MNDNHKNVIIFKKKQKQSRNVDIILIYYFQHIKTSNYNSYYSNNKKDQYISFPQKQMKIKDRFLKQKQMTDRPQLSIKTNTDSTPLLTRLQKQYLINQPNIQKISKDISIHNDKKDKQNFYNMVNSVPNNIQFISHGVINIDNYQNKKFITKHGYQPMMTKSRYMGQKQQNYQIYQNQNMYKSTQNLLFKKNQNQRPLTFGLIKNIQPLKNSIQYQEDIKIKNQILNQITSLRKSQQTLTNSKEYSISLLGDVPRCVNHNNKKAKYRLITDCEGRQEQQMIYCSKCAINLLQQGFKVEQIKNSQYQNKKINVNNQYQFISQVNKNMLGSVGTSSRIQQLRNFQQRLNQVQNKINISLQESSLKTNEIEEIERQAWQTQSLYDQMIQHLNKMKSQEITKLTQKKNKRITSLQNYQKKNTQDLNQIAQMRKQLNECRNRYIIMKESQFQYIINTYINKIKLYGVKYEQNEVVINNIDDQINQIIIELCQFCKTIKQQEQIQCKENKQINNKNVITQQSQDDFICKQIKGPFRTLFPEEDGNLKNNQKKGQFLEHQQDSPSFNRFQTNQILQPLKKSHKNVISHKL